MKCRILYRLGIDNHQLYGNIIITIIADQFNWTLYLKKKKHGVSIATIKVDTNFNVIHSILKNTVSIGVGLVQMWYLKFINIGIFILFFIGFFFVIMCGCQKKNFFDVMKYYIF